MSTSIGETLRKARVEKELTLAEAARVTRIRSQQLMALEQEQWQGTSPVYAKGFLRAYARYLDLDPQPLLESYRERVIDLSDGDERQRQVTRPPMKTTTTIAAQGWSPQPVTAKARKGNGWRLGTGPGADRRGAAVAALLAVGLLGALATLGLRSSADVQLGSGAGAVAAPAPPPAAPPPAVRRAPAAPSEPVEVSVRVRRSTTLRISADGRELLSGRRPAGFRRSFKANEIELRGTDASRVSVVVNGQERGRLGDPGEPLNVVFRAPS